MASPSDSGTLLISALPPTSLGGVDLLSFTPGPNFRGVKLLPPGIHFFFTSPTASLSLRHGLWFRIKDPPYTEPEIYIAKWDANLEHLVAETDSSELLRWRANLGSVWEKGLLSYRQKAQDSKPGGGNAETWTDRGDWSTLTAHISDELLSRILGVRRSDQWGWDITSGSSATPDIDEIPGIKRGEGEVDEEKELKFLPIDLKNTWREGATGRERTTAALDRSWALGEVQKHCTDAMEVLGELEFSFLMVLTLGNFSNLEQWKRILGLLFTCKQAVAEQPDLFIETIRILKLQLRHSEDVDGGLFDVREDGGSFLKNLLRKFRKSLDDLDGKGKADVIDELDELEGFLRSDFGWEVNESIVRRGMLELEDGEQVEMEVPGYEDEDESGDYAPAIVELTSAQKRALGIPEEESEEEQHEDKSESSDKSVVSEDEEDRRDLEDMDMRY